MRDLRRLVLALLFATCCLIPLVAASPLATESIVASQNYGKVGEVSCTVNYHWPKLLISGYFPVDVRIFNGEAKDVVVSLSAEQGWGGEDVVTRRVALAAGEVIEFEMLLRARNHAYNQYRVTFEVGGDDCEVSGAGPSIFPGYGEVRIVLYSSKGAVPAGADERWSEEWNAVTGKVMRHGKDAQVVASCPHDNLSTNWQAYTSIDTLVLDFKEDAPDPSVLAATLAWCRSGGRLLLVGAPYAELAQLPGAAAHLEERFRLEFTEVDLGNEVLHPDDDLAAYRCGYGVLLVQKGEQGGALVMEGAAERTPLALAADLQPFSTTWTRSSFNRNSRQSQTLRELGNFSNLPLRSLMLFIIGFALLMGPVNFLWVKRRKNPMLLLVSVPTIALVTSITLILYGILSQGLDVKSMSRSWSILDQRIGWSTTAEVRRVFAGSAPGEGLRPEAGTLIYPEASEWRGGSRSGKRFTLDLDEGRLYGGDYFPIRQPFGQLLLSDRAARLRLEARLKDGAVEVTNALGTRVLELLLRSPDGEYHYSKVALDVGESSALVSGGFAAKSVEWENDVKRILGDDTDRLLPGSYIAHLETGILVDDCGVKINEIDGRHVLLGILDVSEGAWQ